MLILKGERAPKKTQFLGEHFPKCLKMPFLVRFFFKYLPAAHKICPKQGLLRALRERAENKFDRPKKTVDKIFKRFFENRPPPPPRENPRSAPGKTIIRRIRDAAEKKNHCNAFVLY